MKRNHSIFSAKALFSILFILFLLGAAVGCDDSDSTGDAYNPPVDKNPPVVVDPDPVPKSIVLWDQGQNQTWDLTLKVGEVVNLNTELTPAIHYQNRDPQGVSWTAVRLELVDPDKAGDLAIEDADPDTEGMQPRLRAVAVPNGGYAKVRVSHRTLDVTPFVLVVHIQEQDPTVTGYALIPPEGLVTTGETFPVRVMAEFSDGHQMELTGEQGQLNAVNFEAEGDFMAEEIGSASFSGFNEKGQPTFLAEEAGGIVLRMFYAESDVASATLTIQPPPPVLVADPTSLELVSGGTEGYIDLFTQQGDDDPVQLASGDGVAVTPSESLASVVTATVYGDGVVGIAPEPAIYEPTSGAVTITFNSLSAEVSVTVAPQPPVLTGYQVVVGGKTYPLEEAEGPRTLEAILGSGFGDFALQAVYDYGDPSEVDFTTSISEEVVRVNDDGSLQVIGIGRAEVYFNLPDGMQAVWPLVVIGQVGMVNDLTDQTTFALTEDRVYTDNGDPVDDDQLFLDQFPACFNSNYCSGGEVEHVVLSRVPGSPAGIKVPLDSLTRVFRVALAAYTVAGDGTPSSPVWVEFKFLDSEGNSLGSAWRQSEIFGFIDGTPSEAVYVGATLTTPEGAVAMEIVPEVSSGAPVRMDLPRYIAGTLDRPEFYYDGTREQFPELEVQ